MVGLTAVGDILGQVHSVAVRGDVLPDFPEVTVKLVDCPFRVLHGGLCAPAENLLDAVSLVPILELLDEPDERVVGALGLDLLPELLLEDLGRRSEGEPGSLPIVEGELDDVLVVRVSEEFWVEPFLLRCLDVLGGD